MFSRRPSTRTAAQRKLKLPICGPEATMQTEESIFEKTYKSYLEQLRGVSFKALAQKLGATLAGNALKIQLYHDDYLLSAKKITGPSGGKPPHDICVILCKYILLCPDETPPNSHWVSFKDFKDSGPLINYFTHDVEGSIASYFSGRCAALKKAGRRLGGYPPLLEARYDFSAQFEALPMIPIMLLYNDKDEEFSSTCSILFESRAEKYLDAECIAMLGWQLSSRLRKVASNGSDPARRIRVS